MSAPAAATTKLPAVANTNNKDAKVKKSKRKKEKKQAIEISLWINGCKYEFGLLCTFCAKQPAVCHCPECTDFYCSNCDITAHNTKKRKHHIRFKLSRLDLSTASGLITRAVRRYGHIRMLQERCRKTIKRFFDRKSLQYYYYNPVYKTVSWRKPYCLRKLELIMPIAPEYAASKCQNLYHLWKARARSRQMLLALYAKVFDRKAGNFYYAFHGKSTLIPKALSRLLIGKRSFPRDLLPIYTSDVAALIIQRKWRTILIKQFFRALVRASYDEIWDPVKGRWNYYHRETAVLYQEKPKLLGNEPWDPNHVPGWSVDRVSLFLRRIGLKQYVDLMRSYKVDGNCLVLLDNEDFENLTITNRLHIRKIRVEIDRIFDQNLQKRVLMSTDHEERREGIRRQKMFHSSAIKIQAQFRRYSAQKELAMLRELKRLGIVEVFRQQKIQESGTWWTDNKKLPSKKLTVLPSIGSNGAKLPPIKAFGRNKDHLSHRGWVHRSEAYLTYTSVHDTNNNISEYTRYFHKLNQGNMEMMSRSMESKVAIGGASQWVPTAAALLDPKFQGESSPTLIFSEKLYRSGYDAKRLLKFQQSMS